MRGEALRARADMNAINKQDVAIQELEGRLRTIYGDRRDKTMYIAGAGSLRYKNIIEVIDAAKGAGVDRVGIVTERMRSHPDSP